MGRKLKGLYSRDAATVKSTVLRFLFSKRNHGKIGCARGGYACIALFIEYELGKTEPEAGSQRCGKLIGGVVGASRAMGGIGSSGGVASTRGKKTIFARC